MNSLNKVILPSKNDMLGREFPHRSGVFPPQAWGIFPMLVGKNPHRHGESGELIPPKLVYCPLFKQFGVVALVLFYCLFFA